MRARYFDEIGVDVVVAADGSVARATLQAGEREVMGLAAAALRSASEWKFGEAAGCEARAASLTFDFQSVPSGTPGGSRFQPPYRVEVFRTAFRFDTRGVP